MPHKITPPTKEWLEGEWLLPPRGRGRGSPSIANELNVSKKKVLQWLKLYGINESSSIRRSAHRTGKATWSKARPDRDELAKLYLMPPDGDGLSQEKIAKHYKVNALTVGRWLKAYGLTQEFSFRHSRRMADSGNPAFTNGASRNYHKGVLLRSSKPRFCIWCKTSKRLQVHHVNHNTSDGSIENLEWLCDACNRMESNIWSLHKSGRATFEHINDKVIITFKGE